MIIAFQRAYSRLLKVISAPAVTIWVSDPPKSANLYYLYKLVFKLKTIADGVVRTEVDGELESIVDANGHRALVLLYL